MWKYNKGEWSEIYTFAYLLSEGILYAADKDLNKIEDVYFPIIKIIREEVSNNKIDYLTGDTIRIYKGDQLIKTVDKAEFKAAADNLLTKIPNGSRAFEIPEAERFFESVYCNKVKAASNKKEDITLQIQDIHTGISPVCGFSIKSYLGARPTLINPGTNTCFEYKITGCNDDLMSQTNGIDTRTKIKDRIKHLIDNGCSFEIIENSISRQFQDNLEFIDSKMPEILQTMLLYSYQFDILNVEDVINRIRDINPFNYHQPEIYKYKIKKLLCACALGLTPERRDWLGAEDANGGYITVKTDGSVVCYHLYNRTDFENYLVEYTVFDRPSTTKYNYMKVIKENDEYKIRLCLQIRFKDL